MMIPGFHIDPYHTLDWLDVWSAIIYIIYICMYVYISLHILAIDRP